MANIITIEPGKRGGKPCILGIIITVYDLLKYLNDGINYEQNLNAFSDMTQHDMWNFWIFY
ncbi:MULTISPECIES: DUF433 domain-containing protein [unclassified Microcoleus]|uniref:DUF433 domain-containing protein n=1 Tax=unclassified Microcoleus TaxID=2642155 RepID=UPI002FD1C69E